MKFPEFKQSDATKLRTLCGRCNKTVLTNQTGSSSACSFCKCEKPNVECSDADDIASGAPCDVEFPDLGADLSILEFLGEGGMGRIFKAQSSVGAIFAVKVLKGELAGDKEALKRFEQEVDAVSALDHPNLIAVHRRGIAADGAPYLVMDFIEGGNLSRHLKNGEMSEKEILDIFFDLTAALACAHAGGIIHRDIKPSNVLLARSDERQTAKLVDFGIAKLMPTESTGVRETHDLTKTGDIFGTPNYMSPEQCMGFRLDERSDIYSLGCLMYEVLNGKPPFAGENPIQIVVKQISDEPISLVGSRASDLARGLEAVIFKCLAKKPEDRYQSMSQVDAHLEKLRRGEKLPLVHNVKRPKAHLSRVQIGALIGLSLTCLVYGLIFLESGITGVLFVPIIFSVPAAIGLIESGKKLWLPQPERKQWRNVGKIIFVLLGLSAAILVIAGNGLFEWMPQPLQYLLVIVLVCHFVLFCSFVATIIGEFWFGKEQRTPMKGITRKLLLLSIPLTLLGSLLVPKVFEKTATNLILSPLFPSRYEPMRCLAPRWAEALCRTSILLNNDENDAYRSLAELLIQLKRPQEAAALLDPRTKLVPSAVPYTVLLTRAQALSDTGKWRAAIAVVDKVNSPSWRRNEVFATRARINFDHNAFPDAIADLDKALKCVSSWESTDEYHLLRAAAHWRMGDRAKALEDATKSISTAGYSTSKAPLYIKRAILNELNNNPEAAKKDFQSAQEVLDSEHAPSEGMYVNVLIDRDGVIYRFLMKSYVAEKLKEHAKSDEYLRSAKLLGGRKEDLLKSFAHDFSIKISW